MWICIYTSKLLTMYWFFSKLSTVLYMYSCEQQNYLLCTVLICWVYDSLLNMPFVVIVIFCQPRVHSPHPCVNFVHSMMFLLTSLSTFLALILNSCGMTCDWSTLVCKIWLHGVELVCDRHPQALSLCYMMCGWKFRRLLMAQCFYMPRRFPITFYSLSNLQHCMWLLAILRHVWV